MGTITVKDGISLAGTDGKLVVTTALNDTSGNEVAATFNYTTNKDAGDDTGLLISMTDTKSEGTSLPLDIKVGGSSVFWVDVNGIVRSGYGAFVTSAAGGFFGVYDTNTSVYHSVLNYGLGGVSDGLTLNSAAVVNWDSSTNATAGTKDTGLARSSAGVIKVTDGSTGTGSLVASSAITAVGTAAYNGVIRTGVYKRAWTNAEVAGLSGKDAELKVATLPAKTIVRNAYVVVDTRETNLADLTVALGRTGATYIDYIVASNAQAESLGSELVTNGTFTGNATGWTLGGGGGTPDWYYDTDKVSHASDGAVATLTPTTPLVAVAGTQYKLVWTMAHTSGTGVTASFGGTAGTQRSSSATFTEYLTAASTATLTFTPTADWVGSVDTISLKEVSRTVYGDASGERGTNLVGYDLPSYTATTDVYLNFVTTDGAKNLADALQSTGTVYLMTETLP